MRVGDYEIVGELGRGAMGVVYRARHSALERDVAVKVVQQGRNMEMRAARFAREGQLTANLNHPGIVRVHSAGESELGLYIAYELVEGALTLDEALLTASLRQRVEWIRDVSRALGHAHRRGVIHRDVKPSNVLVCADGQVKVADFGLAVAADTEALTQTGALLGSPIYMSPEAVRGETRDAGAPTDVWALGVLLYEAISGRPPFDGHDLVSLAAQITSAPSAPLTSEAGGSVGEALEKICARALAKAPEQRFQDGEAMASALDDYLRESSESKPARLPTAAFLGAGVGAVLLGLVLLLALRADEPNTPATVASTPKPKPKPKPKPVRSESWERDGQREFRRLARLEEQSEVLEALEAWWSRFQGHPRSAEAKALLVEARWRSPIAVFRHGTGEARGVFMESGPTTFGTDGYIRQRNPQTHATEGTWRTRTPIWKGARCGPKGLAILSWHGDVNTEPLTTLHLGATLEAVSRTQWTNDRTRPGSEQVLKGAQFVAAPARGDMVALGNTTGRLQVIRTNDGRVLSSRQDKRKYMFGAFKPDGLSFATLTGPIDDDQTNRLEVWTVEAGLLVQRAVQDLLGPAVCIAYSSEDVIGIGFLTGMVWLFDRNGVAFRLLSPTGSTTIDPRDASLQSLLSAAFIRDLCFSDDGRWLYTVTGGSNKMQPPKGNDLRVWDLSDSRVVAEAVRQPSKYLSVSASPDGRYLLAGTFDGLVELRYSRPEFVSVD